MSGYRRDIDGLRALAILPVVLFHFRVPGFDGGFTGVDVFFVISGFLITSVIDRELVDRRFSFATFYERRARRLFPALFLVLSCCVPAAVLLLLPKDYERFSAAFAPAAGFLANLHFQETLNYFDGPSNQQPLLHMWSLAVEEQFYLLFPVLLLVARRWLSSRGVSGLLVAVLVASLAAAILVAPAQPSVAFYLPQFRVWELCVGALLAIDAIPAAHGRVLKESIGLAGLLLIAVSTALLSENSSMPIPVPLLACVGAAALLHTGRDGTTLAARLLASRPLVFFGLVSYSLYLWHWPIWVFSRQLLLVAPTALEKIALCVVSIVLATLSWRFIERPFRGEKGIGTRSQILAAAAILLAVAIGSGLWVLPAMARKLPRAVNVLARASGDTGRYRDCDTMERALSGSCRLGTRGEQGTFVLWGDSHGMVMGSAIDALAKSAHVRGFAFTMAGCGPLIGVHRRSQADGNCDAFNERVSSLIRSKKEIDTVVLVARWATYATGKRYGEEPGMTVRQVLDGELVAIDDRRALAVGLDRTLRFLTERGVRIVLFEQVPEVGFDVPNTLARARLMERPFPSGQPVQEYRRRQAPVSVTLDELSKKYRFDRIPVADRLCANGTCSIQHRGKPLYRDYHHLTTAGAAYLDLPQIFADRE